MALTVPKITFFLLFFGAPIAALAQSGDAAADGGVASSDGGVASSDSGIATSDAGVALPDGGVVSSDGGVATSPDGGTNPSGDASANSADSAVQRFFPPKAISDTAVPYPIDAPDIAISIVVKVKLSVAADGSVEKVELLSPPQPIFDDAVIQAAKQFRFEPARYDGKPVPVVISFSQTFVPRPAPASVVDPTRSPAKVPEKSNIPPPKAISSVLRGRLIEMGTHDVVVGATLSLQVGDQTITADGDVDGRFRIELPPGAVRVLITAPDYDKFLQEEKLASGQELAVTYYLSRNSENPYETFVYGKHRREEVSRITLRGPELTQVPGTFGDPFRVIQSLPGVSSVVSLLPFPVVRGSSPSSTGYLLDGTRVPLLYHLFAGPSVIHPEFIDEVQFFPGSAPVLYGGYTGGIVDGRTRPARADESLVDIDANLLLAGAFVRRPIKAIKSTVSLAGRYGYPGLVLGLATKTTSLSYWDYQFRLDGGDARNRWTLFAFGARDVLMEAEEDADPRDPSPPLEPALILGFHRLDLRYTYTCGLLSTAFRTVVGKDRTFTRGSEGSSVSAWVVEPSVRWNYRPRKSLTIVAGLEGVFHDTTQGKPPDTDEDASLNSISAEIDQLYVGSAITETLWRPSSRWLVRPGVRLDVSNDKATTKVAFDPRVTVRYRAATRKLPNVPADAEESGVWLKGGVGIYHQPPRFVLPLPGLDTMPLKYGLQRSIQTSFGAEIPFRNRLGLTVEGFYSDMNPTIFDLSVNKLDVNNAANSTLIPNVDPNDNDDDDILDRLLTPQQGRAFGLEFLLRKQSTTGPHGWISYTLSRAERLKEGNWVAYDFDRTHLLNVVAGFPLPRKWELGLRFQYQSGKPTTTTAGYNAARTDGYYRIDLRIDKHAVWRDWILDFYVDVLNAALSPEEVTPGTTLRYVLPTVGVRGRF